MQSHSSLMRPQAVPVPSATDAADLVLAPVQARQSFMAATPIQTASGTQRLGELEVGQHVMARDGTFAPITGFDHTRFSKRQLQNTPDLAPIRFDPGALPGMRDDEAILVSPDCSVAWAENSHSRGHFPARAFCDGGFIRGVIPEEGVHYIRLHFATTHEVCAGGIWIELHPEDQKIVTLTSLTPMLAPDIRVFRPLHD